MSISRALQSEWVIHLFVVMVRRTIMIFLIKRVADAVYFWLCQLHQDKYVVGILLIIGTGDGEAAAGRAACPAIDPLDVEVQVSAKLARKRAKQVCN